MAKITVMQVCWHDTYMYNEVDKLLAFVCQGQEISFIDKALETEVLFSYGLPSKNDRQNNW
jgi:hypothetical protein